MQAHNQIFQFNGFNEKKNTLINVATQEHQNSEFFSMAVLSSLCGKGILPTMRKNVNKEPVQNRFSFTNIS